MKPVRVVVHGAMGRMGQEIVKSLSCDPEFQVTGAVDKIQGPSVIAVPGGKDVPFGTDLKAMLGQARPQVVVDFSLADATSKAYPVILGQGINMVIGTTGLSQADLDGMKRLAEANQVGVVIAANFSLGAVMAAHLAKVAAKYFDYAEIIEMHHEKKVDAPSGTALATARAMSQARGKPFVYPQTTKETLSGCRGGQVDGIAVHSVRSPGYMAHLEIILGSTGQCVTIRHDQISREGFMPGIKLAAKEVLKRKGLTQGLDSLLSL